MRVSCMSAALTFQQFSPLFSAIGQIRAKRFRTLRYTETIRVHIHGAKVSGSQMADHVPHAVGLVVIAGYVSKPRQLADKVAVDAL